MCSSNKLNSVPFLQCLCPMWWKQDHQMKNEAWICHFLLSVILYEHGHNGAAQCPSGSQASLKRVVYQRHEIGRVTVQIKIKDFKFPSPLLWRIWWLLKMLSLKMQFRDNLMIFSWIHILFRLAN